MTEPIERRMNTAPLTITVAEFLTQVLGARSLDATRWRSLRLEDAIVEQFLFSDHEIQYIYSGTRRRIVANIADLERRIALRAREVVGQ